MRTAGASGADVAVRDLRESPTQVEGISVRGAGGGILLGKRNRTCQRIIHGQKSRAVCLEKIKNKMKGK